MPKRRNSTDVMRTFAYYLNAIGIGPIEREYVFHPTRKWRFDLALPEHKIAVEMEGGVWTQGRHTRGSGYIKDLEKYNEAALHGWLLLRFTVEQITEASMPLQLIERAVAGTWLKPSGCGP